MRRTTFTLLALSFVGGSFCRQLLQQTDRPSDCDIQWEDDEIECHFCDGELECDLYDYEEDDDVCRRGKHIACTFDEFIGPGALKIKHPFWCPVKGTRVTCDWENLEKAMADANMTDCVYNTTQSIFKSWRLADYDDMDDDLNDYNDDVLDDYNDDVRDIEDGDRGKLGDRDDNDDGDKK